MKNKMLTIQVKVLGVWTIFEDYAYDVLGWKWYGKHKYDVIYVVKIFMEKELD